MGLGQKGILPTQFGGEVTYDEDSRVFSAGPITSTRVGVTGASLALENSVQELLSGITNIAREGKQLVVTAGDRSERFVVDTKSDQPRTVSDLGK